MIAWTLVHVCEQENRIHHDDCQVLYFRKKNSSSELKWTFPCTACNACLHSAVQTCSGCVGHCTMCGHSPCT